ncbi:serine hydrolase [Kutzneria sp. 744]|uniref:serine hydrolase domain-containing protein n=1 Tax=Kutzneria sp. (strain 744) TaxID=345341 RepID=UPI0003EECDDF|nr:serine hydrolase domain-containing protein [Kutzneria sp. 744]EWM12517.1 beta-lactamase [Kutzneria sp. 744]
MSELDTIDTWLRDNLAALVGEHRVPAAAVAVSVGDEVVEHAAGVLNLATGVEATTDSLFQIGSITKTWTTTLVMQLVDEGKVDLDCPVRDYLPEFRVADDSASAKITVRHLLSHTSGFEGDYFTDTGRGDDCVEKYVATLATAPQLFAPGTLFSYNNAGYNVLGRLVEKLRGKPYDECLREHLFAPLGLTHAATDPYDAIRFRAALGHLQPTPDAEHEPAPIWALARSNAPAGAMLAMCPRDLLVFARMHLNNGVGPDGSAVLSAASAAAMATRHVEVPSAGLMGDAWGLGWEIFDFGGGTVIGHDGGTIGQAAFLRLVPEHNVAVAVLTNSGSTSFPLYERIVGKVLADLADRELRPLPTPGPLPDDVSRYLGTYRSDAADTEIFRDEDGRIWKRTRFKTAQAEVMPQPDDIELAGFRGDTLVTKTLYHGVHLPHTFVGDDGSGHALFVHTGRADRWVKS